MIEEKQLQLDIHTHTLASGHAYGTIRENAQAAAERGLRLLGISEHAPGIPGTCDPIYFRNLEVVPRNLFGVRLLLGSEINILNGGGLSLEERVLSCLDYRIAGVHSLCYDLGTVGRNTEDVLAVIQNPWVDAIVHPDARAVDLDYREIVPAAGEHHTLLELNNSSLTHPTKGERCRDNYREMLSLCRRYQVPVILGSDAHDPSAVGALDGVLELVNEMDFPEALVMNLDHETFLSFLAQKHEKLGLE